MLTRYRGLCVCADPLNIARLYILLYSGVSICLCLLLTLQGNALVRGSGWTLHAMVNMVTMVLECSMVDVDQYMLTDHWRLWPML